MPEEIKKDDTQVVEPLTDQPKESPPAEAKNTDTMIPKARLDEEIQKRKELEKQSKEAAKRLQDFEAAEAKRREAEMSEIEKSQARVKELESLVIAKDQSIKQRDYAELQRKVAKAVSKELELSYEQVEALADRLRGETEEELIADAKSVFAVLPKPKQEQPTNKLTPKIEPTNPGDGSRGETDIQKRARLLGVNVNVWDPELARKHGGGVTFVEKGD